MDSQSYTMFDHIFWRATAGQVNRWRMKTLGLGSTNLDLMQQHKIPFLYNFRSVDCGFSQDWLVLSRWRRRQSSHRSTAARLEGEYSRNGILVAR